MTVLDRGRASARSLKNRPWHGHGRQQRVPDVGEKDSVRIGADPRLGKKVLLEKLWKNFFANPSEWWDNRSGKSAENERYPDFKHKATQQGLWLNAALKPPWVESELAAVASESFQVHIFSWNKRLGRCVETGKYEEAIGLFRQMQSGRVVPDKFTFVPVLTACARLQSLEEGQRVHERVIECGLESEVYIGCALVDMYAKSGSIERSWKVFRGMPARDAVCWNAMILGLVHCEDWQRALKLYKEMLSEAVEPTPVTFVGVVNACARLAALDEGKLVHAQILKSSSVANAFVASSLVDMYVRCGSMEKARKVFDEMANRDVVAGNILLHAYVKRGEGRMALDIAREMELQAVELNAATFVGVLNACASLTTIEEGRRVHGQIMKRGLESDARVGGGLINMYAKCGSLEDARKVFEAMPHRDNPAWSAMLLGYVKWGQAQEAFSLARRMRREGVGADDAVTFAGWLNACASVASLEEGRHVHGKIMERGLATDVVVGSSLVDMYAKCGSLEDAERVFEDMSVRNTVSWSAMLAGYAMHGRAIEALELFERMGREGGEANCVTFVSLLSACSHGGLVLEGLHYFEHMTAAFGIPPLVDHCACVVDLLGRAGRLHEAEEWVRSMPCKPDVAVWTALLGACTVHGNVEIAERVAGRVVGSAGYVLLSNAYAAAGRWDATAAVSQQRLERGVRKEPGRTWMEVNGVVHSFTAGDSQHPQMEAIHEELDRLSGFMKHAGFVPNTALVSNDMAEEQKEALLLHHSEKLAIAFGLLSTPPGSPLRIFKNLRVCSDCHAAIKLISKTVEREIVVRDANRFHHFQDGLCSCGDYW